MLIFKLYVEVFSQKILVFVNGIDLTISSLFIHKSILLKKISIKRMIQKIVKIGYVKNKTMLLFVKMKLILFS